MNPAKVQVVLLVAVAAAAVVYQVGFATEKPAAARAPNPGPPAGAEFAADPPEAILGAVGSAKRPRQAAAAEAFIGLWVPDEGWEGVVEEITREASGPALRVRRINNRVVGGEVWIVALVDEGHGASVGNTVRVQGKIRDVRVQAAMATVSQSIVLEQARVVSRQP